MKNCTKDRISLYSSKVQLTVYVDNSGQSCLSRTGLAGALNVYFHTGGFPVKITPSVESIGLLDLRPFLGVEIRRIYAVGLRTQ